MTRRPNPRQTLTALLNATGPRAALAYLTHVLGRAWAAGYSAGWRDGVADANSDNPPTDRRRPNPYESETRS